MNGGGEMSTGLCEQEWSYGVVLEWRSVRLLVSAGEDS